MNYREYDVPYERANPLALSEERVHFIRSTYAHLAGALLGLAAVEAVLMYTIPEEVLSLFFGSTLSVLFIMLAFMGASYVAQMWAQQRTSVPLQYAGLALCVGAYAIIMFPLLYVCTFMTRHRGDVADFSLIGTAGILTLGVFFGLTAMVFLTGKDFSFLRPVLLVGSFMALGLIVAAWLFGFSLGLFFSFAMVALMAGYLLYQTSMIMRTWPTDLPVAAALMLFASVATLFFYILRILSVLNGGGRR
jgi:FtsH-binding integral membrane protein